jgi:DNA replication and repair protein RecF
VQINKLILENFRNYSALEISFFPPGAVFTGPNGSGKTNILEAIHFLCTAKSQRNAHKKELMRFDSSYCFMEGRFSLKNTPGVSITASIGIDRDRNLSLARNGEKITSLCEWYGIGNIVSFSPRDMLIVSGPPVERRRFMDMFISQIDKQYLENLIAYRKYIQNRNNLLRAKASSDLLDIYEQGIASRGAEICIKRVECLEKIIKTMSSFYSEICAERDSIHAAYKPSLPSDFSGKSQWENVFYERLKTARKTDREAGFTSIGPHRDDVIFYIRNSDARLYASQGQCRSLALALKLSCSECLYAENGEKPVFLIDDALSELDEERSERIVPLIDGRGQLFITMPQKKAEFIKDIPQYIVAEGSVAPQ